MITVAIGTTSSPAEAKGKDTDTQRRRGSLLDAKIAPQAGIIASEFADLAACWQKHGRRGVVRRDAGERDGAPMSKMRQSRSFGGEILTTP